jgi:hypothetical protein
MAWRLDRQPNGLLARFSEVVDDFTDYDMTDREAIELCKGRGMNLREARAKILGADADYKRLRRDLETVAMVHGQEEAEIRRRQLSGEVTDG